MYIYLVNGVFTAFRHRRSSNNQNLTLYNRPLARTGAYIAAKTMKIVLHRGRQWGMTRGGGGDTPEG